MIIKRFKSISFFGSEVVDYELPESKFTESLADQTFFIPTSESVRSIKAGDISPDYYDFPDGKDTGVDFPIARDRRSDIAQVSQEVIKLNKTVGDALNDAKEMAEYEKKISKRFEKKATSELNATSKNNVSEGSSVNSSK